MMEGRWGLTFFETMGEANRAWRWEIYRAGRTSPIERSEAGKAALRLLLSEYSD
jgi:hypothetical protein